MRTLLMTIVATCSMTLVMPVLANDYKGQAEGTSVEDARSRGKKSKSRSRSRSSGNHGGSHHSLHHRTSTHHHSHGSSHHVVHHTSHRRTYRHGVVVRTRPAHVRVVAPAPAVVVHPSRPTADRTVDTVATRRRADKTRRFSLGGSFGVMSSKHFDRTPYTNLGVEAQARYRIADPLGFEISLGYYGDVHRDIKRIDVPFTSSVMLHTPSAAPVGLFLLGGVTLDYRDYDLSCIGGQHLQGGLVGGHVGAGLHINLGPDATLEWDVRYTRFFNETGMDAGGVSRHNVGSTLAVNYYF